MKVWKCLYTKHNKALPVWSEGQPFVGKDGLRKREQLRGGEHWNENQSLQIKIQSNWHTHKSKIAPKVLPPSSKSKICVPPVIALRTPRDTHTPGWELLK